MAEVRRPDLTTIATHPYEPTVNQASIAESRSHYLDDHFEDWQVLVSSSKTMSAILRHGNQFGYKSNTVSCVDKEKWLQNVKWPMADFTKWLAPFLYYNNHVKTWKFRRVFEACNIFTSRQ